MVEVSHAKIHTTTVELKIVTVNNRQMTLSVFRQIPEKSIFDLVDLNTLKLKGTPWGRVNYFWPEVKFPDCLQGRNNATYKPNSRWENEYTPHKKTQVLWQSGSVLHRTVVYHREWFGIPSFLSEISDAADNADANTPDGKAIIKGFEAQSNEWNGKFNKVIGELLSIEQLFIAVGR